MLVYVPSSQWNLFVKLIHYNLFVKRFFHEKLANALNFSNPYMTGLQTSDLQLSLHQTLLQSFFKDLLRGLMTSQGIFDTFLPNTFRFFYYILVTCETELFVMLINGFQPLTNVRKNFILDAEKCHNILRSSRQEVFYENGVLENLTKLTEKYLCRFLFYQSYRRSGLFLKKRHSWFNLKIMDGAKKY